MALYNAYTGGVGISTIGAPLAGGTMVGLPIFGSSLGGPPWANQYNDNSAMQLRQMQALALARYDNLYRQAAAQNEPLPEPTPVIAQTPPPGPVHVNLDVSEPVEVAAP